MEVGNQYFTHIVVMIQQRLTQFCSVHFSCSVVFYSLRPMNCSTPGLPVHYQLPEFTQTHVL